jgi:hypothetical protein
MALSSSRSKQLSVLKLLGRSVTFHPALVDITGSINAALMLSQALYWTEHSTLPDGWFWKTREEWYEETRLDRKQQENARARLRATGFWEEKEAGKPCRLFFRVNEDALDRLVLSSKLARNVPTVVGTKRANLRDETCQPLHAHKSTTRVQGRQVRQPAGLSDGAGCKSSNRPENPDREVWQAGAPSEEGTSPVHTYSPLGRGTGDLADGLPDGWGDEVRALKGTLGTASRVLARERAMLCRLAGEGLTLTLLVQTVERASAKARERGHDPETLLMFEQDLEDAMARVRAVGVKRGEPERVYRYWLDDAEARHARKRGKTLEMVVEQGGAMTMDEARQAVKAGRVSREDFPRKESRR